MNSHSLKTNDSDEDKIKKSDICKSLAIASIKNKDYYKAKEYLHQGILHLKVENDGEQAECLDQERVFALKVMCQSAQTFINHQEWGYNNRNTNANEIVDVLLDQCHYLKVPGYEKITKDELEEIIKKNSDGKSDSLKEKFAMDLLVKIFDGDGSDFAVNDHMGLYHGIICKLIFDLADMATILNVNVALISKDMPEPAVFKQKQAIATIYIGSVLNFDDNPEQHGYIKFYSEYQDKKAKPSKSLSDLVAHAPCSYESRTVEQSYSPTLFNSRQDNDVTMSEEIKSPSPR